MKIVLIFFVAIVVGCVGFVSIMITSNKRMIKKLKESSTPPTKEFIESMKKLSHLLKRTCVLIVVWAILFNVLIGILVTMKIFHIEIFLCFLFVTIFLLVTLVTGRYFHDKFLKLALDKYRQSDQQTFNQLK